MSNSNSPKWRSWHYILLWIVAIMSLIFNILLLAGLYNFRLQAQQEVASVTEILNEVEIENFDLPVVVDEKLAIDITVPFSDTFKVPIDETVPISMTIPISESLSFPIDETVSINRDVTVSIVILGQSLPIDIPIRTQIPISLDVDVPIQMEVPVDTTIPITMDLVVPIDTEVPIQEEVPVKLDFPVTIPLDELGFNVLLIRVKEGLRLLADVLGAPTELPN